MTNTQNTTMGTVPGTTAGAGALAPAPEAKWYLCEAWGETDIKAAGIVKGLGAVRAFIALMWLGESDQDALDDVMREMQEEWSVEGVNWAWKAEFEIGGLSVQQVAPFAVLEA